MNEDLQKPLLAYVTFPDKNMAEKAAFFIVEKKYAAGCNIIGPVSSIYTWKEKIHKREEWVFIAQISRNAFDKFLDAIIHIHTDRTPCILALPIDKIYDPFKLWIVENSK